MEKEQFDNASFLVSGLPGINGLELKRPIEARSPGMKCIVFTGYGSGEDPRACSEESGKEYSLIKPVQIEVLMVKFNEIPQQ